MRDLRRRIGVMDDALFEYFKRHPRATGVIHPSAAT